MNETHYFVIPILTCNGSPFLGAAGAPRKCNFFFFLAQLQDVKSTESHCAAQAMLSSRWRRLVQRTLSGRLSDRGAVWAAPHRWGCTLVATRKDKLLRCVHVR